MKKIYFAAVTLAVMLLTTACSNDEIQIEKVGRRFDLSLNIGTQTMYNTFDIASKVRDEYLRDGGRVIGVMTYVYDSEGNLVANQLSTQNNFNNVSQTFTGLVEGDYTAITIETLVNPDDDYKAEDWTIDDIEKISTLKISQVYTNVYYGGVLGVATTNVKINGSNTSLNVTPSAIGSLVNYFPTDLEETNFVKFSFVTNDVLEYYSLNPAISRSERYHEDLSKKNTVNIRHRADVEESTGYFWTFYMLESSIEWMNAAQDETQLQNNKLSTWQQQTAELEDGKVYYAGFYYLYADDESMYAASYFGDATGYQDWYDKQKEWKGKNVHSTSSFAVPYTNWSVGTVSAVRSYMSDFSLNQEPTFNPSSNKYEMTYFDLNNMAMYEYDFKTSTNGLTDAYVYLDGETFSIENVRSIVVNQGYTFNSQNNNNYYYTSATTYVTVYQSSSGTILVNYYDPKAYGGAPRHEMPVFKESMAMTMMRQNKMNIKGIATKADAMRIFNPSLKKEKGKSLMK